MYGPETVFFQQAAHLTGGSYVCLEKRESLLQYLIASTFRLISDIATYICQKDVFPVTSIYPTDNWGTYARED